MEELEQAFNDYFNTIDSVIKMLDSIITKTDGHYDRCKVAKVAGTAASIFGGVLVIASLIAASFTGGTSIVAATGIGSVCGLGGAAVNVTTDIIDLSSSKSYNEDIQNLNKLRESCVETLDRHLAKLVDLIQQIENYDSSKDNDGVEIAKIAGRLGFQVKQVGDVMAIANASKNFANFGLRSGGQAWKSLRLMSNSVSSSLRSIGIDVTRKTAMNIVKGGTVILTAAFIIWDIKSLSDSLNGDHPLADVAKQQIQQIRQEKQRFQSLHDTIFVQN